MKEKTILKWNGLKKSALAVLLIVMMILAACGSNEPAANNSALNDPASAVNETNADNANAEGTAEAAGQTEYPLTMVDVTGTEIVFEQAPTMVVTLVPSATETLFAVGAGEEVIGVDEWSNYPEEAAAKPKIGDLTTNIESVSAMNPDLVVASASMNAQAIEQLRALGVTVFASNPKTLDETIAHIEEIGVIMNKQEQASAVAEEMRAVKQQVVEAVKDAPKKRVYLEFSPGYSVGKGEFLDELLTLAGGENIAGDQEGWFQIDAETVLQSNPEVIIYPDMGEDKTILELIQSRPGWDQIDAVKNDQVFAVANDPLVRVGPRLTDGLLEMAKAIHPDLVK
ncbi:ABC transporter substrate-binding protein [Paenibacillus abyssi]|uniref:ABC transporter substrate-binding protein n=1 Tax=Paenibacillus abyssi TaxID=1340531 RepID=A0A917FX90_9BACL|nr:ABC transporter substrate-binding protein [Paenibacillus abyssi]GGG11647.1 ABC transporter substrate-binding protein [Paenibacillus abyssi]